MRYVEHVSECDSFVCANNDRRIPEICSMGCISEYFPKKIL